MVIEWLFRVTAHEDECDLRSAAFGRPVNGILVALLPARPGTSPFDLRAALRNTASQSWLPDNDYGWGIIDAEAALQYLEVTGGVYLARLSGRGVSRESKLVLLR